MSSDNLMSSGNILRRLKRVRQFHIPGCLSSFFVSFILYSTLIVSSHHHDNPPLSAGCALCVFALEFSSADNAAQPQTTEPFFKFIYSLAETLLCIPGISSVVPSTRAPPLPTSSGRGSQVQ